MPYEKNKNLPESVQNSLPEHAQDIYRKAFNAAWQEYKSPDKRRGHKTREETAHAVAWSAVKNKYRKISDERWAHR